MVRVFSALAEEVQDRMEMSPVRSLTGIQAIRQRIDMRLGQ